MLPRSVPHPRFRSRAISRDSQPRARTGEAQVWHGGCCATSHGTHGPEPTPDPTPKSRAGPGTSPFGMAGRGLYTYRYCPTSACTCGNAWALRTRQVAGFERLPHAYPANHGTDDSNAPRLARPDSVIGKVGTRSKADGLPQPWRTCNDGGLSHQR